MGPDCPDEIWVALRASCVCVSVRHRLIGSRSQESGNRDDLRSDQSRQGHHLGRQLNRLTQVVDSISGTITYSWDDLDRLSYEQTRAIHSTRQDRAVGISSPHGCIAGRSGVNSRTRPAAPARIRSMAARSAADNSSSAPAWLASTSAGVRAPTSAVLTAG